MKTLSTICLGFFLGCAVLFGGACFACNSIFNVEHIVTVEKTDESGKTKTVTTYDVNGKTTTTTYDVSVSE